MDIYTYIIYIMNKKKVIKRSNNIIIYTIPN